MDTRQFTALLKKKRAFFEAILALTKSEETLSFSALLPILEQKKVLLSCIDEIDIKLGKLNGSFSILPHEIQEELAQIRKTVETILHLDAYNQNHRKKSFNAAIEFKRPQEPL